MAGHNEFSGAKKKSSDLLNDIPTFNAENLQSNMKTIYYSQTFLSIIGGVIAGILGFTSLTGFILYFLIMAITSAGLMAKSGISTHSYFDSWNRVVLDGFFSGLMSFVLFWTYHLAGGRCIGGVCVTVQEQSTWPWAGLIPLAISFILVQRYIDYRIASGLGPLVLFSFYAFSSISLGLCWGHHTYVQAEGCNVHHPEA